MQRTDISGQRLDWRRGRGMKRGLSVPSVENLQLLPSMLFRWAHSPQMSHTTHRPGRSLPSALHRGTRPSSWTPKCLCHRHEDPTTFKRRSYSVTTQRRMVAPWKKM